MYEICVSTCSNLDRHNFSQTLKILLIEHFQFYKSSTSPHVSHSCNLDKPWSFWTGHLHGPYVHPRHPSGSLVLVSPLSIHEPDAQLRG